MEHNKIVSTQLGYTKLKLWILENNIKICIWIKP
jgi:hypothetical protein